MKKIIGLVCAVTALVVAANASAANPKTGPITNYSVTCSGLSFDYNKLPSETRIWLRYTLGHQPYVLTLEQLVMLSGSGTFTEPVPVEVEQPTTVLDALVRVPSLGIELDRSIPGGCTPAPPPPPPPAVVVPPSPAPPTAAPPPAPTPHHKMCHHRRRCHCGHKHRGHRGHHHRGKLRICHKPNIRGGFICGTHPHPKHGRG